MAFNRSRHTSMANALILRRRPKPKNPGISAIMRGNRGKDTGPEVLVRRLLRAEGVSGYRLHWPVIGRPDIAFPGRKVAFFVHGCFWHGHSCGVRMATYNRAFWDAKILENQARDAKVLSTLHAEGWAVVVIWECSLRKLGAAAL